MTAAASSTDLGSGFWRVEVDVQGHEGGVPIGPDRFALVARGSSGARGRVVTAAPVPGTRTRWALLVEVPAGVAASSLAIALDHRLVVPHPIGGDAGRPRPVEGYADVDYTARDFTALTTMLTELVTATSAAAMAPGGAATPVPQAVALIEQVAYLGDALSYQLDAVATEAHLATARQRTSVTRHAAALGYRVDQGANARVWLRFDVAAGVSFPLPAGSQVAGVLHRPASGGAGGADPVVVFETMHEVTLHPEEPALRIDRRDHAPGPGPGATSATVEGVHRDLAVGELVLVRSDDARADAVVRLCGVDVLRDRQATRLTWSPQDALRTDVEPWPTGFEILRHNLVLADEGRTVERAGSSWLPLPAPGSRRYRPALPGTGLVFAGPRPADLHRAPASAALEPCAPGTSLPAVSVAEHRGGEVVRWTPAASLVTAGPFDRELVVELDNDDVAHLRFGDDLTGARPAPGADLRARYRTGVGEQGNVRPRTLTSFGGDDARVVGVSNPVAAVGGRGRQPLGSVRLLAPETPSINDRAVVEADQLALARQVPGVVDVAVRTRWSGAWRLVEVAVRLRPDADAEALERVRRRLAARQLVGVEVAVGEATAEPIEVAVRVGVERGADRWRVEAAAESLLSRWLGAPDGFGLGVGLAQSAVVARLSRLDGVADVTFVRFRSTLDAGPEVRSRVDPAFGRFLVFPSGPTGRRPFVHGGEPRR